MEVDKTYNMDKQGKEPRSRGGYREGAGRKKLQQGVKHLWVIPQDIHELAEKHGTAWLWDAVRFKVKFDQFGKEYDTDK